MEIQYIHQYLHHIEYLYTLVDTYNDIDLHLNYNKLHSDDMVMNDKDFVPHINHSNLEGKTIKYLLSRGLTNSSYFV